MFLLDRCSGLIGRVLDIFKFHLCFFCPGEVKIRDSFSSDEAQLVSEVRATDETALLKGNLHAFQSFICTGKYMGVGLPGK